MADYGGAISGIGEGIGGIVASRGAKKAAKAYDRAAAYAGQAAGLEQVSTDVQLMQAKREIYQTIGAQKAAVAGAGLAASGSALDLLADSQSQGALTMALTGAQGEINVLGAQAQQASYQAQAELQRAAAKGGLLSGIFKVVGSVASLAAASDRRLKENIVQVGTYKNGLPMYEFNYRGGEQKLRGVMSDDVRIKYPDAVVVMADGFDAVHYDMLGIRLEKV